VAKHPDAPYFNILLCLTPYFTCEGESAATQLINGLKYDLFVSKLIYITNVSAISAAAMGDSSYRLNFDQGKKNEIQHTQLERAS
jgi:hypothetical protein